MMMQRLSLCFPAWLHLILVELVMLPLFQYAVYSFLRDALGEIAILSWGGQCGACSEGMTPKAVVSIYGTFLWLPSFEHTFDRPGYIDTLALVPVGVNYGCLILVSTIWLGTVLAYCLEVRSLLIPMGSGRYLRFLWRNRTSG